jgi:hypothetical protein
LEHDEAVDGVAVHLADIYEICRAYQSSIDRYLQSSTRKQDAKTFIKEVEYNLYEHLPLPHEAVVKGIAKTGKTTRHQLAPG